MLVWADQQQAHAKRDALALLQPLEVVCMTGPQLYEVWRRVKCEGISANEFFGLLARHPGGPFQMP